MLTNKNRKIASWGESHLDRMVFAVARIEVGQSLSEPMRFHSCDCVIACIEYSLGTAKDFSCDVVFIELVDVASEQLLSHILEYLRQSWPLSQCRDYALQFRPFRLGKSRSGILGHD